MVVSTFLSSIRVRLAAIILLAMTALVGLLIYQGIQERAEDRRQGDENLQRLAIFAAQAERERFDTAERLLILANQAESLRAVALDPGSTEAFDRCTSSLFVLDQLLPETSGFALWDTSGNSLCSSEAAARGEFSAADNLWFQTAQQRGGFATGGFELSPPDDEPAVGFGVPVRDPESNAIIAYLSTGLALDETHGFLAGSDLPETGRLAIVDQTGTIISSTGGRTGQMLAGFHDEFGSLNTYLNSEIADGPNDRRRAAVRITDADDAAVTVVVGADKDALAAPLGETLARQITPVALLTLLTLGAVWFLADRWIVRPVGSLVDASDHLAAGRLGARARNSGGVAEFEKLSTAFNEMAEARQRATQAKDDFLGLVSHELKTPITTTMGNSAILRTRGDKLDPELRQVALDDIYESSVRLASLIDNMLALARLERGVVLESEPLALLRVAQAAAEEQIRRSPGRRVLVRGDSTLLVLAGDTYVDQVLGNLIGNAMKYTPADAPVDVVVERDGDNAAVRVLDRGHGIDPAEADAIFQPFYRSPRTESSAEGIGIGLSVCKRLIEAMGGRIWSKERAGGGAEFGFTLPLVPADFDALPEDDALPVASAP